MIRLINNPTYGNIDAILGEKLEYVTDPTDMDLYKFNNMKEHYISWVCLAFAMRESIDNLIGASTVEDTIGKIKTMEASDEIKATLLDFYSQIRFESYKLKSAEGTMDVSNYMNDLEKKQELVKRLRAEDITCDPYDQDYGEIEEEVDSELGQEMIMDLAMQNKALSDQLEILKKQVANLSKSVNTINESVSSLEGEMKDMSLTTV